MTTMGPDSDEFDVPPAVAAMRAALRKIQATAGCACDAWYDYTCPMCQVRATAAEALANEEEQSAQAKEDISAYDEIIVKRIRSGVDMTISKHRAANAAYCSRVIAKLEAAGQQETADLITWLLWWRSLDWQTAKQVDAMRREQLAS